jgi:uncharacterized RDD family membrane protein YckC
MNSSQEDSWSGYQLSGWWERVGAYLIDGLLISLIGLLLTGLTGLVIFLLFSGAGGGAVLIGVVLFLVFALIINLLVMVFYYCLTMQRPGLKNGQSPGKEIFSIAVKREDGQEVDFKYALIRQVLVIYLFFNIFVNVFTASIGMVLNYLWPLWDDKRQAFHDKMVGSRVVKL